MLYILFSPAEGKHSGGQEEPLSDLLFGLSARETILNRYNDIVTSGDTEAIKALFGIKKEADTAPYLGDLFSTPTMSAIERYNGVAYEYLDYLSLSSDAQTYLKNHTLIFSNLYGVVMGGDKIANYKVKQGNSVGEIAPDKFYAEAFKSELDSFLKGHEVLDLRAGYYDKFYKVGQPHMTLKFIKGGKVVSHWAKAYRGIVLRHLASHQIESLDEFRKMEIDGVMVNEIKTIKNRTEIVFDIV
ncbi:MAG: YaaA family protein [Campylobacterota bacterium]|nr:YaaA family protein [Campylobacterota bacterium]